MTDDDVPRWAADMDVDAYVDANSAGVKAMVRAKDTASAVDDIVAAVLPFILADLRAQVGAMKDEAGYALLHAETHDDVTAASVGISVLDDVLALFDGGSDD